MLRELLLDRAATLDGLAVLGDVFMHGTQDAPVIDRPVLEEPAIFRRHDRLAHDLGDFIGLQDDAVFHEDAAQFLAVDIVKAGGDVEIVELLQVDRLRLGVEFQRLLVSKESSHRPSDEEDEETDLEGDPEDAPEGALGLGRRRGPTAAGHGGAAWRRRFDRRGGWGRRRVGSLGDDLSA